MLHKPAKKRHGPRPGRERRYAISLSDFFAGSIQTAGMRNELGKGKQEFDDNE
jgi:hypothetical protein